MDEELLRIRLADALWLARRRVRYARGRLGAMEQEPDKLDVVDWAWNKGYECAAELALPDLRELARDFNATRRRAP
jgi:hypothetical protein